jgi:hypothetical protein
MVTVKTMRNACASWATPGDEPFTGRLVCNTASWHRCWCGSHFCCMDKFQCHTSLLRHLRVYPTPRPQHFVRMLQIHGHLFRHLVPFRPRSHALEVSALMLRVEVDKRHRLRHAFQLVPHLSKHANIRYAHQLLPQNVQALRDVDPNNVFAVREGRLLLRHIVVVVPVKSLPQCVLHAINDAIRLRGKDAYQAMQVVQSFNVCDETAAVHILHSHLIRAKSGRFCFFKRNNDRPDLTSSQHLCIVTWRQPHSLPQEPSTRHRPPVQHLADTRFRAETCH